MHFEPCKVRIEILRQQTGIKFSKKDKKLVEPLVIGICGGSASGKTTVANKIITSLDVQWVTLLSMDSFYKVLTEEQHLQAAKNEYNFDHPGSLSLNFLYFVFD